MSRAVANQRITNIPTEKICGVYSLTDENGLMYIGSSKDIQKRCRMHQTYINGYIRTGANGYINPKMKNAISNGVVFRCDVLARFSCAMDADELREVERILIKKYKQLAVYNCQNIVHKV